MKEVMISVKPKWCELMANGRKTVEVRKTKPTIETPFKCYIYCTQEELLTKSHHTGRIYIASHIRHRPMLEKNGNITYSGKVIGEFVCDLITGLKANNQIQAYYNGTQSTCLTPAEIVVYANGKMIYYWHISELKIYDKPKELSKFGLSRPPQSWCYVEKLK